MAAQKLWRLAFRLPPFSAATGTCAPWTCQLAFPTALVARNSHDSYGHSVAVFENDVLTLTLPKAEEVKPKTIRVREKVAV